MAETVTLYPTNTIDGRPTSAWGRVSNPEAGDPDSNPSWPPPLTETRVADATMHHESWAGLESDVSPYNPPDPSDIYINLMTRQVLWFVFDVRDIDVSGTKGARFTIDFNEGGSAFIDAYEIKSVGQAPAASNVRSFSGDWITLTDQDDIPAAMQAITQTPLDGTAFQNVDFLSWFATPYWDVDVDDQGLDLGPHHIDLTIPEGYLDGRDWVGIVLSFDQPATYFTASFDTGTPDGTFYQVYGDAGYISVNPVTGVSLTLDYAETPDDDPRPLPDIAIAATAVLGIDGPLLKVSGLAESPVDRPILSHAARRMRGW